jgi:hypothetical protein
MGTYLTFSKLARFFLFEVGGVVTVLGLYIHPFS